MHYVTPSSYSQQYNWPFNDLERYIMINFAIDSEGPNSNTVFPSNIQVDYVRVYQTNDVIGCMDINASNYNPNATISGPCDFDITFNVNMNCYTNSYNTVYITGPFNNWCGDCDPMSDNDGDGIWSLTKSFSNSSIEYKYSLDNWLDQEDLVDDMQNGSSCAPITDYWNYANRIVDPTININTNDTWGSCDSCTTISQVLGCTDSNAFNFDMNANSDDGSCLYAVTFTLDMNCYNDSFTSVYISGPFNSWCGQCQSLLDANNDGIWEATYNFPAGDLEYKYSLDNWTHQEDLIDDMVNGGSCAPVTDYWSYANRLVTIAGATITFDNYGSCDTCVPAVLGCTDPNADNYDSSADTDDGSCTYCSTFALSIDSQSDASASGASDGTAVVSGSGGTSPYSISWPADPNALSAGTYTVTATDAAGCTASIDVTIDEPTAVTNSTLISDCDDFVSGPAAWPYILVATTVADGAASQAAQTFTMNITSLPAGGANVQVYKTTANGGDFFATPVALTLGCLLYTSPSPRDS